MNESILVDIQLLRQYHRDGMKTLLQGVHNEK